MTFPELIRLACVVALAAALWWRHRRRRERRWQAAERAARRDALLVDGGVPLLLPPAPVFWESPERPTPHAHTVEELDRLVAWEDTVGAVVEGYRLSAGRLTEGMTPGQIDVTIRALCEELRSKPSGQINDKSDSK
jgi:hypothetical protein